jgi:hypothetical protein
MNLAGARRQPELCRHWASARSRQPEMSVSVAPRNPRPADHTRVSTGNGWDDQVTLEPKDKV